MYISVLKSTGLISGLGDGIHIANNTLKEKLKSRMILIIRSIDRN
jgi:hypothetical protein